MTPYVIRQGDHLPLLALQRRLDLSAIWNHPRNAQLKALRKRPNILAPGDIVYLPDPAPVSWMPLKVRAINHIAATVPKARICVTFAIGGAPLAGVACIAHGMPEPNRFTTDGKGKLTLDVPLAVKFVTVEFPSVPLMRRLCIGHLDPVGEPSGAFQRLRALGYLGPRTAAVPGSPGLATAISAFQRDSGLTETGSLDAATIEALEREHGC
jgi:Putative peptidoglycan binding domain